MENRLIVEGVDKLGGMQLEKLEKAELVATVLYSNICHRFKQDKNYGEEFVKTHQDLMGQLTIAAVEVLEK